MKIEAGKYYKTRDGRVVGPMKRGTGLMCHWVADTVISGGYRSSWFIDGSFWPDDSPYKDEVNKMLDLIEPAYPEQGTLKEIGAKVGDVVQEADHEHQVVLGVKSRKYQPWILQRVVDGNIDEWEGNTKLWRIIYRASDKPTSPFRTVTTTRKEVVPGVYGRVVIERESNGDMVIDARNMQTADELTAAIDTLTEIRDALT